MQPLTFPCPLCSKRMGVGLELAGKSVRCPHCQKVVTAPSAATAASARPTIGGRESVESIFADPAESEDSVFGQAEARKVQLPPAEPSIPVSVTQPTPPSAVTMTEEWLTADEPISTHRAGGVDLPVERPGRRRQPASPIPWQLVAIVTLAVYSVLMTVLAAWGWMRTPGPAETPPSKSTNRR